VQENNVHLHRVNHICAIQGSLAIKGNTLTEMQITAVLERKTVIAPPHEAQEVRNAIKAYEKLPQ
jgi:Fic family protein